MQGFRRFDEKAAVDLISKRYSEKLTAITNKESKRIAEELRVSVHKKDQSSSEEEKIRATMNEGADQLIGILREKIS